MAAATGFSFGSGSNTLFSTTPSLSFGTSNPLTGSGSNKRTSSTSLTFGTPATSTSTGGLSFTGSSATVKTTSTTTGFSFGAPATSSVGGLFGSIATTTATTTSNSLFGPKTTATAGSLSFGGFCSTNASSTGFSLTSTTASVATSASNVKPFVNPKDEKVPNELSTLVTELETFIKSQKDIREEISKISSHTITKSTIELVELKQNVALIANALQRDSVAVENLKYEVSQELRNTEVAYRIKDVAVSLQHEFSAPMEYFCRLVYSFEVRINTYRKEIEELEIFLSTSSLKNVFSPQDLLTVLRRVNNSFIGLASELQQIHEAVKVLKEKYLHFRRVVYNDTSDPFASRKKIQDNKGNFIGPSPIPVVQGAVVMASAFKQEQKAPALGFGNTSAFGSTFSLSKPPATGLTRSLSFGGTGKKTSSLFDRPTLGGASASLNLATPSNTFMLQKPPSGKRGKF